MGGWETVLWGAVVATGSLLFLRLVADEIESAEQDLHHLEVFERRAQKRRIERAAASSETETGDVVEVIQAA